jgi:hypothetical protein
MDEKIKLFCEEIKNNLTGKEAKKVSENICDKDAIHIGEALKLNSTITALDLSG